MPAASNIYNRYKIPFGYARSWQEPKNNNRQFIQSYNQAGINQHQNTFYRKLGLANN